MYRLAFTLAFASLFATVNAQAIREPSRAYIVAGGGSMLALEGGTAFTLAPWLELRAGLALGLSRDYLGNIQFTDDTDNPVGNYNAYRTDLWALVPVVALGHARIGQRIGLGGGLGLVTGGRAYTWNDLGPDGLGRLKAYTSAFSGGLVIGPRFVLPSFRVALGSGRVKLVAEGVADLLGQATPGGWEMNTHVLGRVGILF